MEIQGLQKSQNNFEKEQRWKTTILNFKLTTKQNCVVWA